RTRVRGRERVPAGRRARAIFRCPRVDELFHGNRSALGKPGRDSTMDAAVGRETDAVDFLARLADVPYDYDFYQTLRRLGCFYATAPRWGEAQRPMYEPVRPGPEPAAAFPASPPAAVGL